MQETFCQPIIVHSYLNGKTSTLQLRNNEMKPFNLLLPFTTHILTHCMTLTFDYTVPFRTPTLSCGTLMVMLMRLALIHMSRPKRYIVLNCCFLHRCVPMSIPNTLQPSSFYTTITIYTAIIP